MDFFFNDPSETRLPPDEVRIRDLQVQVLEDGRKVKVYLEVDPFQKRPSVDLAITDPQGKPRIQCQHHREYAAENGADHAPAW